MNLSVSPNLGFKRWFPKIALVLSGLIWVFLAVVGIGLLFVFVWFYWHYYTTDTCLENECNQLATWFVRFRSPLELYALLSEISFIVPTLIWIALGFWVFLARPGWVWSYVFSVFFLVGWYGEINLQYLRGSFYDAVVYVLQSLHVPIDPRVFDWSLYFRRIFKMLADNIGVLVMFSFPNGRFFPRWSLTYVFFYVLFSIGYSLPGLQNTFWNYNNWGFPYTFLTHIALASGLAYGVIVRYRSSEESVRLQVRGVIPAMLANILVTSSLTYFQDLILPKILITDFQIHVLRPWIYILDKWLNGICMIWWAVAVAQAIVRQKLFDIRFVLNRTLVYSALILSTGLVYGIIVGGLGTFFRSSNVWLSVLATGVIAVLFQPLLIFFRQTTNRLFYGDRHDPYRVISKLGQQLENALKPEDLAQTIVDTVATTLRLPFVALNMQSFSGMTHIVAFGEPVVQPLEFPLLVKGRSVGSLLVSSRFAGEAFSPGEIRLLEDLASRAAAAVQEALLSQELQASKEEIVLAREEERKRIRRDLHDGLGPMLASLSFQLQATRSLVGHDPTRADALLETSAQNVQDAITDIRRLVYGLRPPALDDLGLDGALRQQVGQMLGVFTDVQIENLEPLPAALEVATYRIACEALNNIAKHAKAKRVQLSLKVYDGGLQLIILDDGVGFKNVPNGVGMHSMRERALELGGEFSIQSSKGTRVTAWLPLRK